MLDLAVSDQDNLAGPNVVKLQSRLVCVFPRDVDSPLAYALAGCGRRCVTLFHQGKGAFQVDTETTSSSFGTNSLYELLPILSVSQYKRSSPSRGYREVTRRVCTVPSPGWHAHRALCSESQLQSGHGCCPCHGPSASLVGERFYLVIPRHTEMWILMKKSTTCLVPPSSREVLLLSMWLLHWRELVLTYDRVFPELRYSSLSLESVVPLAFPFPVFHLVPNRLFLALRW